jgi:hypothetical protein
MFLFWKYYFCLSWIMKIRVQYLVKGKQTVFSVCDIPLQSCLRQPFQSLSAWKGEEIYFWGVCTHERDHIHSSDWLTMKMIASRQDYYFILIANDSEQYICYLVRSLFVNGQGKNKSLQAGAILWSLIPVEYLQGVLSLGFTLTNPAAGGEWLKSDILPGLIPSNRA